MLPMRLTKREKKKIKKYGKNRFHGEERYNEKVMFQIYEKAGKDKRKELDEEMDLYLLAIEQGVLKKGDSIMDLPFAEKDLQTPRAD